MVEYEVHVSPYCFKNGYHILPFKPEDIIIHDTTLREGEQAPGVVFSVKDKIKIAEELDELGIQQIEGGFPAASPSEFEALKEINKLGLKAKVFGFGRAVKSDIDAVADTGCFGLVLSFPPSDIHIKYKLKITREEYLRRAVEIVEYAKERGLYITYSAEDSTRADLDFLKKVFKTVVEAGVDRARIVDTLGCITPPAIKFLVSEIRNTINMPVEVHCHNDHNLALANTLAALEAGANVLSTSILGLGERAGLAATEELIVALHNFYNVRTFKTEKIFAIANLVASKANVEIWSSKPVVGRNVFTHESGIHQDGVIKNPITYEPYPPEMVGQKRRLLLSKVSGKAAVKYKLEKELGISLSDEEILILTQKVKQISSNRRSALSDEEFKNLVGEILANKTKEEVIKTRK